MKGGTLIAIIFLFGCTHSISKKQSADPPAIPKSKSQVEVKDSLKKVQVDFKKSQIEDSPQLKSMMRDILAYAYRRKHARSYTKSLEMWDSSVTSAILSFGNIFDETKKHLIVRRSVAGSIIYVDIFLLKNNVFRLVCSQILDNLTYLDDTTRDVNGDFRKDFLVHWYPSSGCCRRDVCDVYLYQQANGTFSKQYEFINPTFSSSEKIIRGVTYGYQCQLYKYRWNGHEVDTIEFIAMDKIKNKFHIFHHFDDCDNEKVGRFITRVPREYRKINSYDWFENYH